MASETRYMECQEGGSDKFYEVTQTGTKVVLRYGRCGAAGVSSEKHFASLKMAEKFADKTCMEKMKKGYASVASVGGSVSNKRSVDGATKSNPKKKMKVEEEEDEEDEVDEDEGEESGTEKEWSQSEILSMIQASKKGSSVKEKAPAKATSKATSKSKGAVASTSTIASSGAGSTSVVRYMECQEGGSDKFYEVTQTGTKVVLRYGRCGAAGVSSEKHFASLEEAKKFADKTCMEKQRKGYKNGVSPTDDSDTKAGVCVESMTSEEQLEALENGVKIHVKGSSALPYTLRKFNGGYSCTCLGWTMNVKNKGVQATSCKHLRQIRGDEEEDTRCEANAGIVNPSLKSNRSTSIVGKISLAKAWLPSMDPKGYIMSEKLDGMRAYWHNGQLHTRSGIPVITPPWFTARLPLDMDLDGELFLGRQMFNECMTITRRTDGGGDWKRVKFVVFDAPTAGGGILDRLAVATALIESLNAEYAVVHPHYVCDSVDHLLEELAKIEQIGGEGLMLRKANAAHRGGRSTDLLKVKSFHDDEALILDYEKGKGKYEGMVGALVCVSRSGARFKVGSGLTDQMRQFSAAPKTGQVITFKYFELTPDGIPRFPTFLRVRPDVDKSEFPST